MPKELRPKTPLMTVIYCHAEGITSLLYSPHTVEQVELPHLTDHYYINLPGKNANKPEEVIKQLSH